MLHHICTMSPFNPHSAPSSIDPSPEEMGYESWFISSRCANLTGPDNHHILIAVAENTRVKQTILSKYTGPRR